MTLNRQPRLSLDLLRGFRAAARHLSFTRAARELFVTQSAISHEVKTLEEQLGTPLFARANRSLKLTRAGEQLYRAADEALALIDSAADEVTGAGRALTITTTVPLASLWLTPRLPAFLRMHPEIGLRVVASNDNLDLARERIDLALRYAAQGTAPPSSIKLFDFDVFPVCAPAVARDAVKPIRTVADLALQVRLEFETVRGGRSWYDWDEWLAAKHIHGLKSLATLRFSHYDQVVAAAIAGSGVAIGKWPYLEHQLQQGVLVTPFGSAGAATIGSFYLVLAEAAPAGGIETFASWLMAEARKDAECRDRRERSPTRRAAKRGAARRR